MKKLLFVFAFTFIGQQAFSQIYLMTLSSESSSPIVGCTVGDELTLTKITPAGVETHTCIPANINDGALISLNQEINSITSQGYKLIETSYSQSSGFANASGGMIRLGTLCEGTTFIFAIP